MPQPPPPGEDGGGGGGGRGAHLIAGAQPTDKDPPLPSPLLPRREEREKPSALSSVAQAAGPLCTSLRRVRARGATFAVVQTHHSFSRLDDSTVQRFNPPTIQEKESCPKPLFRPTLGPSLMNLRHLTVNADDFGLSPGVN